MPKRDDEMNSLIEALHDVEAEKIVLQERVRELEKVHTNYRGQYPDAYHAWSGDTIAYGCSEAHAESNLREKIRRIQISALDNRPQM